MHQSFVSPAPGDTAGLKCQASTSDESRQCRGCAGVLISRQYTVTLIQIRYGIDNIQLLLWYLFNLQSLSLMFQFHQNNAQLLFHIIVSLRGARAFSGDFTINLAPQRRAFSQALKIEKLKTPLFPGPRGAGDTNDWCIIYIVSLTVNLVQIC